jgi:hypothetical protein
MREEAPMADYLDRSAQAPAVSSEAFVAMLGPDWDTEDAYWQSAYPARPYARADRGYEYYRAAYRFGAERSVRYRGEDWNDLERTVRREWLGSDHATHSWEEMRTAIRDAWDHVRGRSRDERTHIR